jgi:HSP20 family molecular chaperone IbpA
LDNNLKPLAILNSIYIPFKKKYCDYEAKGNQTGEEFFADLTNKYDRIVSNKMNIYGNIYGLNRGISKRDSIIVKEVAKDIIEKTEKELKFDNNIDNSDKSDKQIIKLYQPENIILKKCYIDELGFSNFKANGLEPKYNYYKKDDQIIIRIELPGNCSIETSIDYVENYTVIKINGTKSKDKEPKELEQNIFNSRENGKFYLKILLKTEEYLIKNEPPKIEKKEGIFILSFKLDEKIDKVSKYNYKEEEEI